MFKRLMLLSLLMIVSCHPAPTKPEFAMPRYDNMGKIPVNAASFRVVQQYQSPGKLPYVEDQFPVQIATTVNQWFQDRIQPAGSEGVLIFTITDAHVQEDILPKTQGIKAMFTKEQIARYSAKLVVTAELQTGIAGREANAEVTVTANKTLSEEQSRDVLFHNIMKEMLEKFNPNMQAQLTQRFKP